VLKEKWDQPDRRVFKVSRVSKEFRATLALPELKVLRVLQV
jgi:hypothetical protein